MQTEEQGTLTPEQEEAQKVKRALVSKWQDEIKRSKDSEHIVDYHKNIKTYRRRVEGFKNGKSNEKGKVRTNLIFSTLRSQQSRIYAKNPELSIAPSKAVNQTQYKLWKNFSQTAEVVVNRQLTDAKLKKRGKASVRASLTCKIGWLKASYQRDIQEDPIIVSRINDTQENIRKIENLLCECKNAEESDAYEAKKAELGLMVKALENEVEVTHSEGMVLDRVLSEDMLWCPDIPEFEMVSELSPWMAQGLWFNKDGFKETFGREPGSKSTVYAAKDLKQKDTEIENSQYRVWEIWDKTTNTILTICEGDLDFCREPYSPATTGERWYPFFDLALIPLDGTKLPMSGVELLDKLQDEYEETREKYSKHRDLNKPHYIAASDTDVNSIERKQNAELGEIVIIDTDGKPLNQVFQKADSLSINQADYDTSPIRADMEMMSGLVGSAQQANNKSNTLGEAQILENGVADRSNDMTDQIEDWFLEIGKYTLEILLQELAVEQVKLIAGEGAQWPEMEKEQIFDMVNIEVRAGSSGKPNKMQEQKNWIEFMPQFRELIQQVAELRQAGKNEIADSIIALARETIRRFDDRIDIDEFLPQQEEEQQPENDEEKRMALQQQMEAAQKELEKMDADIRKTTAEAVETEVDTQIKASEATAPLAQ